MDPFLKLLLEGEQPKKRYMSSSPEDEEQAIAEYDMLQKLQQPQKPIVVPDDQGGLSALKAKDGQVVVRQINAPYTMDQEAKDLRRKTQAKTEEILNQQASGVSQLEQSLNDMKNQEMGLKDVNLAPIIAYMDSWTGDNVSKGYKAPETQAEKLAKINALEEKLQGARSTLTEKELGYLKTQLDDNNTAKLLAQRSKDSKFDASQLYKKEKDIGSDLNKEIYEPLAQREADFANLEENLASGDSQKISGSLSVFARLISGQKGVLTDKDIALVLPRNFQGDFAKFFSYFNDNPSEKMNPVYTKQMQDMIGTVRSAMNQAAQNQVEQKRESYKARRSFADVFGPGGSGDEVFDLAKKRIMGAAKPVDVGGSSAPAAGAASGGFPSIDQFHANKKK